MGLPLISRRPSAQTLATPFCLLVLNLSFYSRNALRLAAGGEVTGATGRGFSSRYPTPHLTRLRGDGPEAQPRSPLGLGGRRPRPRGGRPGAPAPTTATQRRPRRAPHAPATARPSRATRAPEGSRTSPPGGGGAGGRERGTPELVGWRRELQPHSAAPLSHPCHPQRRAPPSLGVPAVASATAIPLHLPVDAIFSLSSSFSQRPSPSRGPPRRRTAQARNPQPRTLP